MKPAAATATTVAVVKPPNLVKTVALFLLSVSVIALFYNPQIIASLISSISSTGAITTTTLSPIPPPRTTLFAGTGIVDDDGVMTGEFEVGEYDQSVTEEIKNLITLEEKRKKEKHVIIKYEKFKECDEAMTDYIPCLDDLENNGRLNMSSSVEKVERHCPQDEGLNCLIPVPIGYQKPIPWPRSRDEVWLSNVRHNHLIEDKAGGNWTALKGDRLTFPGGRADQYLDLISQMAPDMAFGKNIRVALDIGCGVASFGAILEQRNVTTLSIAPKNVDQNYVQLALERGVPAMVAGFASRRLLYPSQAFDLIHCSSHGVDWTSGDGILLLEANRLLRAGGYFVWATKAVTLKEQWKEIQNLSSRICWELVKKEGHVAIWRKPLNNGCYFNRDVGTKPPLCDSTDDPDNVWYIKLRACITPLPESGYGANVRTWPTRLHNPPDRLQSIKMAASISRKELFNAESVYWNDVVQSYIRGYRWKDKQFRNVLDMNAGFGGFAAAMHDLGMDCWVLNVVPVNGINSLPVIYDRGLIGVMHDWCEPFDTYPRTYDLIYAANLLSTEQKRQKCNISTIMLEMDRMLRPAGGNVHVIDRANAMSEVQEIAKAMGWVCAPHYTHEGPFASYTLLICEKRKR